MSATERGSKSRLAQELGISRASLYYRRKIPEKDDELRRSIEFVMTENPGYGYRRVALALNINAKRAQRVMKKFHLKPARRGKTPRKPLDEGRVAADYPDILSKFSPIEVDFVWVSDFTFINYRGVFFFLATVLDRYTWVPLGFNISRSHEALFVRVAIERAVAAAGRFPEWFHSDQGSEYLSAEVAHWLEQNGTKISTSPKSSPWRNGSQESFFGRFKTEFGDPDRFESSAEFIEELYTALHYFGNIRIKTQLKMSPAEFRQHCLERQNNMPPLPPCQNTSNTEIVAPAPNTDVTFSAFSTEIEKIAVAAKLTSSAAWVRPPHQQLPTERGLYRDPISVDNCSPTQGKLCVTSV